MDLHSGHLLFGEWRHQASQFHRRPDFLAIRQDAEISFGQLDAGHSLEVPASEKTPHSWLQVIEGQIEVLGRQLGTGDGIAAEATPAGFEITAQSSARFLLFRLA